jgi:hypothetical protein
MSKVTHRLHRSDLLWLLAFPIYQTLGTIRHEGSHAITALAEGASIDRFVFWPSFLNGRFYWGYVQWTGVTDWLTTAAPYLNDLFLFILTIIILSIVSIKRHWLWLNVVIVGLLSPFANSAYNYLKMLIQDSGDVRVLRLTLGPLASHAYFIITLGFYFTVLYFIFKRSCKRYDLK